MTWSTRCATVCDMSRAPSRARRATRHAWLRLPHAPPALRTVTKNGDVGVGRELVGGQRLGVRAV
jgi:hypothetical protein